MVVTVQGGKDCCIQVVAGAEQAAAVANLLFYHFVGINLGYGAADADLHSAAGFEDMAACGQPAVIVQNVLTRCIVAWHDRDLDTRQGGEAAESLFLAAGAEARRREVAAGKRVPTFAQVIAVLVDWLSSVYVMYLPEHQREAVVGPRPAAFLRASATSRLAWLVQGAALASAGRTPHTDIVHGAISYPAFGMAVVRGAVDRGDTGHGAYDVNAPAGVGELAPATMDARLPSVHASTRTPLSYFPKSAGLPDAAADLLAGRPDSFGVLLHNRVKDSQPLFRFAVALFPLEETPRLQKVLINSVTAHVVDAGVAGAPSFIQDWFTLDALREEEAQTVEEALRVSADEERSRRTDGAVEAPEGAQDFLPALLPSLPARVDTGGRAGAHAQAVSPLLQLQKDEGLLRTISLLRVLGDRTVGVAIVEDGVSRGVLPLFNLEVAADRGEAKAGGGSDGGATLRLTPANYNSGGGVQCKTLVRTFELTLTRLHLLAIAFSGNRGCKRAFLRLLRSSLQARSDGSVLDAGQQATLRRLAELRPSTSVRMLPTALTLRVIACRESEEARDALFEALRFPSDDAPGFLEMQLSGAPAIMSVTARSGTTWTLHGVATDTDGSIVVDCIEKCQVMLRHSVASSIDAVSWKREGEALLTLEQALALVRAITR